MNEGQGHNITMEALAKVLGGAFIINFLLVLVWFGLTLCTPEWFFKLIGEWFAVSRHEFDLVNYAGIAVMKLINMAFFLSPYLAIKFWLRKRRQ